MDFSRCYRILRDYHDDECLAARRRGGATRAGKRLSGDWSPSSLPDSRCVGTSGRSGISIIGSRMCVPTFSGAKNDASFADCINGSG